MKSIPGTEAHRTLVFRSPLGVITLAFLMLASAASLRADILASYNMENSDPVLRISPSTLDVGVTSTTIARNNLNAPGVVTNPNSPGNGSFTTWITTVGGGTTVQDALSASQYFSITVAPVAGNSITLSSLSFDLFAATSVATSARQTYVFADKTGFADTSLLFTAGTLSSPSGVSLIPFNNQPAQNFSIDLTGYDSLADITDSVTFRIYCQTPNAVQGLAFDNLTVSGIVTPVPEPSSVTFVGLSVFALLATKRFRRIQ